MSKRLRDTRERRRGAGYVDALLALAFVSMVLPPALFAVQLLHRALMRDRDQSEAADNLRSALSTVSRLARSAGNNPHGISLNPVRIPDAQTLSLQSDLSGGPLDLPDGRLDDPFEQVTIRWDSASGQITLASGSGSRQPLARWITRLEIVGLNRAGDPAPTDSDVVFVHLSIVASAEPGAVYGPDPPTARAELRVPILSRLEAVP